VICIYNDDWLNQDDVISMERAIRFVFMHPSTLQLILKLIINVLVWGNKAIVGSMCEAEFYDNLHFQNSDEDFCEFCPIRQSS
jgi:hypothetical protein